MNARIRIVARVGLLVVAALACAKPPPKHEYTLVPGQAHAPGLRRALVAPLNATASRPPGYDANDARIEAILDAHLESKGVTVVRPSPRDFRNATGLAAREVEKERLKAATGTVSSELSFEEVVPFLFEKLGSDADLLIVPNVVRRYASAKGGSTFRWDGVRRRETGAADWTFEGDSFEVASMFVTVFRAHGAMVFSGFGGLDTIWEFVWAKRGLELREDRLQNEEYLAEGICVSLYPYFGEDERC